MELKKSKGVFKKGETTGRTKKEGGECLKSIFFLNGEGNPGTKEKRGRELKVCEKEGGSESVTEKYFF